MPKLSTCTSPLENSPAEVRPWDVDDRGLETYAETYALQKAWVEKARKAKEGFTDRLIVVEHEPVYTYGRKNKPNVPLLNSFEIERGGEATYHNPGQLVAYPILYLRPEERDLHRYLRTLEKSIVDVLADYGIVGESKPGATGVWMAGKLKKIASLGVAVSGWVTYHGLALNVCNDLSGFFRIDPCGFSAQVMTSLEAELGTPVDFEGVKQKLIRALGKNLGRG